MASRRPLYVVVAVAAAAGLALVPVTPLLLRDRLPDPIAAHWTLSGTPDGHTPLNALPYVLGGLWLTICLGALAAGLPGWGRRSARGWTGAVLGSGAGLTAGVLASTLRANLDRSTWRDAAGLGWAEVLLTLGGAAGIGLIGWLIGRLGPDRGDSAPVPGAAPRMALAARERAVWIGYVHNRWVVLSGALSAAVGAVAALLAALLPEPLTPGRALTGALLPLALTGVVVLVLSSARVTVDARGLAVAFGPLGWPVRRIALDRITLAWSEDRSPLKAGGWGYRVSGLGTTVMLRGGECLVVRRDGGGDFAVSVDDAERAAAVLNSLRERAAA